MKTKSLIAVAGILALMGVSHAEEGEKKPKKEKIIAPEILEKYDKNQDGKLCKAELAEMKKDKANKPKKEKKPKVIAPEILAKYDKDQDGQLSKEERAEIKKDKPKKEKKEKKPKKTEESETEN